jgi:hypothetical protein
MNSLLIHHSHREKVARQQEAQYLSPAIWHLQKTYAPTVTKNEDIRQALIATDDQLARRYHPMVLPRPVLGRRLARLAEHRIAKSAAGIRAKCARRYVGHCDKNEHLELALSFG